MDHFFNQLLSCQSETEFMAFLVKYLHKEVTLADLLAANDDWSQAVIQIYLLKFHGWAGGNAYQQLLLDALLDDRYLNQHEAEEIYPLLHKNKHAFFQLGIIKHGQVKSALAQIERLLPDALLASKKQKGIVIFSFDHGPFVSEAMYQTLSLILTNCQSRMYLSYPYDQLLDSSQFYRQTDLFSDMPLNLTGSVAFFEDYYLEILFTAFNQRSFLSSLIHPHIKRMLNHDRKYHTPYIETIQTYIHCQQNAAKAAAQLDINKSTLFYRFKKIGEMLGCDFWELDLFTYAFSLRLCAFLGYETNQKSN